MERVSRTLDRDPAVYPRVGRLGERVRVNQK